GTYLQRLTEISIDTRRVLVGVRSAVVRVDARRRASRDHGRSSLLAGLEDQVVVGVVPGVGGLVRRVGVDGVGRRAGGADDVVIPGGRSLECRPGVTGEVVDHAEPRTGSVPGHDVGLRQRARYVLERRETKSRPARWRAGLSRQVFV